MMKRVWILNLILAGAAMMAAPVFAQTSNGMSGFRMSTCLASNPNRCLTLRSSRMDQATLGTLWVGDDVEVRLREGAKLTIWSNARVIVDLSHDQISIESLGRRGGLSGEGEKEITETVISLSGLTVSTQKWKL
ncbi:MAG: hypothetical protein HC902_00515 [Calothrix sp. SM1_5_4]|nr:hypothetical protein [Calothrix sp. SM1_5_4]